ncbi:MAG: Rpn family recombination-promoting nuclease/putative transposase [Rickettsiales bacterium]|jgi:predicted transposase/invertase (TIGR01784 family)|nr:Rpn family recombination-promoting nuclease/putative transposase [Rickettsiales bacterium]
MKRGLLDPKNDVVFKALFGSVDSKHILKSFLKSILVLPEEDYEEIYIADTNSRITKVEDKLSVLDLKLKMKTGKIINIEIQIVNEKNLENRIMYYSAGLIREQLKTGEEYKNLNRVINITIINFTLRDKKTNYHHKAGLYYEDMELMTDLLEINILELPKVSKTIKSKLDVWMNFLKTREKEELDVLVQKEPELEDAVIKLVELSEDETLRALAFYREKALKDKNSQLLTAREEGLQEGMNRGRQELINNMLAKGLSVNEISDLTGIDIHEIKIK